MPRSFCILLGLAALVLTASVAHATSATDICSASANPCLVTTDISVAPGSVLDFGTRALDIRPTGRLRVTSGTLGINAGSLRIEGGGLISGAVGSGSGASIDVHTTGDVRIELTGSSTGRIDVTANISPGQITITSDSGNVTIGGHLEADGTGSNGIGGFITVDAGGTFTLSGLITARGGVPGLGGRVAIKSVGTATISGPITASGGDGGDVDIESTTGDVVMNTTGDFDISAGGSFGDGGSLDVLARGNATLNGTISGGGAGSDTEGGGFGAEITLTATTGNVSINGPQDLHGAAPDGEGGDFDAVAGLDATIGSAGRINLATGGLDACGGFFSMSGGRNTSFGGSIDVGGGFCGGDIDGDAGQQLTISSDLNSDATADGGDITMTAQHITTSGRVHASGTGTQATGGFVGFSGCTITQSQGSSSLIQGSGLQGIIRLEASGQMTIGATMRATNGEIDLVYRQTPPTIQPSATITPSPIITQDTSLPQCLAAAICGNGTREFGEECDDGNTAPCDGCSPSCMQEACGNGVVDCNEECDAGPANGAPGSQCSATCTAQQSGGVQFLPGRRSGGCVLEWAIVNPGGALNRGFPDTTQTCIDGDPSCDADGTDDGGCDFTVSACLNVTDERLPTCNPVSTDWVNLRRPSPLHPADASEQANATALVNALHALGVTVKSEDQTLFTGTPDATRDHCTAPQHIRVPHAAGITGRRLLHGTGKDTAGSRARRNRVTLACAPNPSQCGNGVTEVTETCDDGNTADCDGCSSHCQVERCGDGVVTCGEQCDDGAANGTPGAACTAHCTQAPPALRIPGGPSRTDCVHEWSLVHGAPTIMRNGLPSSLQVCTDGDPSCDFDPTPGSCRFHLWECVGAADDRIGCAADGVAEAAVVRPGPTAVGPAAQTRQALVVALGFLDLPSAAGELCGGRADIDVPAGRRRLVLRAGAKTTGGVNDRDTLRLGCTAAP